MTEESLTRSAIFGTVVRFPSEMKCSLPRSVPLALLFLSLGAAIRDGIALKQAFGFSVKEKMLSLFLSPPCRRLSCLARLRCHP